MKWCVCFHYLQWITVPCCHSSSSVALKFANNHVLRCCLFYLCCCEVNVNLTINMFHASVALLMFERLQSDDAPLHTDLCNPLGLLLVAAAPFSGSVSSQPAPVSCQQLSTLLTSENGGLCTQEGRCLAVFHRYASSRWCHGVVLASFRILCFFPIEDTQPWQDSTEMKILYLCSVGCSVLLWKNICR